MYEEGASQGSEPRQFSLSHFRCNGYGPDGKGETWKHQKMEFQMGKKSRLFTHRSCSCDAKFVEAGHHGIKLELMKEVPVAPSLREVFQDVQAAGVATDQRPWQAPPPSLPSLAEGSSGVPPPPPPQPSHVWVWLGSEEVVEVD